MDFESLLTLVGDDPVFESSLLLAGDINPGSVRQQLSRWVNNGQIYQLRRGLYAIAPPYQKVKPHPFKIANHLQKASYVSLQTALAYYGLIPEIFTITTSVTGGRPERLATPLGSFEFHHLKTELLFGYQMTDLGEQSALLATPEKALLDLIYLQPGGASMAYLGELRLQNTELLDIGVLKRQSDKMKSPKLIQAVRRITQLITEKSIEYEDL